MCLHRILRCSGRLFLSRPRSFSNISPLSKRSYFLYTQFSCALKRKVCFVVEQKDVFYQITQGRVSVHHFLQSLQYPCVFQDVVPSSVDVKAANWPWHWTAVPFSRMELDCLVLLFSIAKVIKTMSGGPFNTVIMRQFWKWPASFLLDNHLTYRTKCLPSWSSMESWEKARDFGNSASYEIFAIFMKVIGLKTQVKVVIGWISMGGLDQQRSSVFW